MRNRRSRASRRRNRYGDNGVASLGEARAHQRLRQHSRVHHDDQARRAVPKAKPKPQKQRDRRNIKTTKPLLATRFGAGRPRRRLIATLGALLLVIGLVLTKVGLLQGGQGTEMRASAAELWTRTRTLPAQRGAIFDRNGDELALSVPAATVAVNPQQIEDVPGTVDILARLLKLTPDEAAELQADIESSEAGFMYVGRQIDPVVADQIAELELLGVSTYPEDRRIMPGGDTGQSVIGRTDIDGNGIAGLELQYGADTSNPDYADFDDILRGVPGEMTLEVAPGGRTIAGTEDVATPAVAGVDLITTLDRSVQYSVEQALLRQVGLIGAKGGQVIVLDTDTGDVIAMATVVRQGRRPGGVEWQLVGGRRLRARFRRQDHHDGRRPRGRCGHPRVDVHRPVAVRLHGQSGRRHPQRLTPARSGVPVGPRHPRRVVERRNDLRGQRDRLRDVCTTT